MVRFSPDAAAHFYKVTTIVTLTAVDRRGRWLVAVDLAKVPDLGQPMMTDERTALTTDVLGPWDRLLSADPTRPDRGRVV